MARLLTCWVLLCAMFQLTGPAAMAATPEEIDRAKAQAVAYFYAQQKPAGHWEQSDTHPNPQTGTSGADQGQWGGTTALITYALLAAGESPTDPRIEKAVAFLREANITGVYALGMRAQVWSYLPESPENTRVAREDFVRLVQGMIFEKTKNHRAAGLYDYRLFGDGANANRVDLSASQYGVLGVWTPALHLAGAEVPRSYWETVENAWLRWLHVRDPQGNWQQVKDPALLADPRFVDTVVVGWSYTGVPNDRHAITASMTAAGVATLFITQDFLRSSDGIACNGNISNPVIDAGLRFLVEQMPKLFDRNSGINHRMYTIYGIERIGVASGFKYFGTIDWYARGADYLTKNQNRNGNWGGLTDSAFGLLFLAKGGEPVMFNKLRYSLIDAREARRAKMSGRPLENPTLNEGSWNQRPRDVANIAAWIGQQSERTLNWQIIDLNIANTRDLHDAPIAYISGADELNFREQDKQKLKDYVERGGMILFNPDCTKRNFEASAAELAKDLFDREFEVLPADHPIFTTQQFPASRWRRGTNLRAVTNGARVLMLLPGDDLGRMWQQRDFRRQELYELSANIYQYAIDKEFALTKGRTFVVEPDASITPTRKVEVARIEYKGNWNPEPGGWRQLAAILHNRDKIELTTTAVDIASNPIPDAIKVAHLTGTEAVQFSEDQIKNIKAFIDRGGRLIIDSAGGKTAFADSMQQMLTQMFPDQPNAGLERVNTDHALFKVGGGKPVEVRYRGFALSKIMDSLSQPRVQVISVKSKPAVIFSREDLSVGLVGTPVDGIVGYTPEVAQAIMRGAVLME